MRVYVRDGKIVREEQAGNFPTIEKGVPDMNPLGCQKGVCWSQTIDAPDRVLYPLRRAGERGEGRWQRVSWDEALTAIADSMLDAIQEKGPESIIELLGAEGVPWNMVGLGRLFRMIGSLVTDVNAEINDFSPGLYLTFGKFNLCSSLDDAFHSRVDSHLPGQPGVHGHGVVPLHDRRRGTTAPRSSSSHRTAARRRSWSITTCR